MFLSWLPAIKWLAPPFFAAARLTDIGFAIFLGVITFDRAAEWLCHRRAAIASNSGGVVDIRPIIILCACFVVSGLTVLSVPLSHYLFQWPPKSQVPQPILYLTIFLRGCMSIAAIYAVAHNPKRQVLCCLGWALAVHIFILGPVAWALIH